MPFAAAVAAWVAAGRALAVWLQKVDPKTDGAARDWVAIYDECSRILYQEIDYTLEGRTPTCSGRTSRTWTGSRWASGQSWSGGCFAGFWRVSQGSAGFCRVV